MEITCEFDDVPDEIIIDSNAYTTLPKEYLLTADKTLRIKKIFKCTSAKPKEEIFICSCHPTTKNYEDLLELKITELKKRLDDLSIPKEGINLSSKPSIRHAIWKSCPNLNTAYTEIPVTKEDSKTIWDKINESLPIYALFQSDRNSRDSDPEVQDPMKIAITTALSDPSIQTKLNEVQDAVKIKAVELAERTQEALKKIDAELADELKPEFKADPKWAGVFSLVLKDDKGISVNKRGSGVRRLILVSFFRAEAERQKSENNNQSIIYAIEEPETSQHPDNQRILLDSFKDLAAENGCQVILTTHSPSFASYLPVDSFIYIKKERIFNLR